MRSIKTNFLWQTVSDLIGSIKGQVKHIKPIFDGISQIQNCVKLK